MVGLKHVYIMFVRVPCFVEEVPGIRGPSGLLMLPPGVSCGIFPVLISHKGIMRPLVHTERYGGMQWSSRS